MSGVKDYSSTAASNIDVNGVSIAEGMAPSNVNNAMREMMADQAKLYSDTQTGITSTGTSSAYAFATSAGFSSYTTKTTFRARMHATNAGACTANVDLIGAKNIKVYTATGLSDPWVGAMQSGSIYEFAYASTPDALILINPTPQAAASSSVAWPNQFKIINGDFGIDQRNGGLAASGNGKVASPYPAGNDMLSATTTHGADRWFVCIGAVSSGTWERYSLGSSIGHLNPTRTIRVNSTGQIGVDSYVALIHRIESASTYAGQTVTFFQWLKRATAGNVAFSIRQNFGTGGSPSADVKTYIGQATLTTSFAPYRFVASVPSVAGKTFGTNNDDYLEIVYWISAGSDYNATTGSLGLANTTVDFYGVHDRPGNVPIEVINFYQTPDQQTELARCQRYYEIMETPMKISGATPSIGQATFAVQKRAAPTLSNITFSGGTGATFSASKTSVIQTGLHSQAANVTTLWASAEL